MSAIEVDDVSICYEVGDFKNIGLKDYVIRKLKRDYTTTKFWADRHITFSLDRGEMLGILGTNGAGKSTLLKVITGIMAPTEGRVHTEGKIAALLELATGFDGELTVKENTYLRGALLGYTREFMDAKYDEIIQFAELEEFQDRLFNQLSSGMKSRLGFAIACLVEPDIIILDEVLSVGDGAFKEKSGNKMRSILASGVTGILVSHSVDQVRELCSKVLWIEKGEQIACGDMRSICDAYSVFLATPKAKRHVPKSQEEIDEISRRYRLYLKLSAKEKVEKHNDEFIMKETENARIQRWMKKIDNMDDDERAELLKEYL